MRNDGKQLEREIKIMNSPDRTHASKLIFNWVKAGDINVKQFVSLCETLECLYKQA